MPTPSKFTVATRRAILEALSEGNSRHTAAGMAGIAHSTLFDWIARGADSPRGSQYRQFAEEVAMAEAAARGRALRILNTAMVDQPKWAAWFLERRDPAFAPPKIHDERPTQNVRIQLTLPGAPPMPTSSVTQLEPYREADSS